MSVLTRQYKLSILPIYCQCESRNTIDGSCAQICGPRQTDISTPS